MESTFFRQIASELKVRERQVGAAAQLLDEGATVPFIARYRKEVTEGLDDTQLRTLEQRLYYIRELEERRNVILKSITDQSRLTPELEASIRAADNKSRLEDLYLPYKPKRRSKGQIAREAGLAPLAEALRHDPSLDPDDEAGKYLDTDKGVTSVEEALKGARSILIEQISEDADLMGLLRAFLLREGRLSSRVVASKEKEAGKFRDYFEHNEPLKRVPSHRALAIFRGRNSGLLNVSVTVAGSEDRNAPHPCEAMVAEHCRIVDQGRKGDAWLRDVVRWAWRLKLLPHLEAELIGMIRETAEQEAIKVFSKNLGDLLLAAPAGSRCTIGLDPGLRTGVKVAVVDDTGKMVDYTTIFPHAPHNKWSESLGALVKLILKHDAKLIAIGNGTASRATDQFAAELIEQFPKLNLTKVVVSEAGASVYSASELAAKEFPDLDVSFRGAVSIARRLQDPLAELVKIDPKAIGVGQYQHDVNQSRLARGLDAVVEDCVNVVGVDVNMASSALLSRVSGLNPSVAQNIVRFRDENGRFGNRNELKKVPRLGDKTFEQSAGFLRISGGDCPLDGSAVHPEAYPLVEQIAAKMARPLPALIGDSELLAKIEPESFVNDTFGLPTVVDILAELDKPGRDPRPLFKSVSFRKDVTDIADLKVNMELEGVVSNVTNFGAFVDIGVHQDGLVHISALSNRFVKDPREVVRAGEQVKVKVLEVDVERRRIALTMRLTEKAVPQRASQAKGSGTGEKKGEASPRRSSRKNSRPQVQNGTFADLFADARKLRTGK